MIWSAVAVIAEVPSGAIADRFSRRWSLVAAGVLQALGYVLWITLPGFWCFAGGFVLWSLGGSLVSGTIEALLYDGLLDVGAAEHYAVLHGRVEAIGLFAQLPAGALATVLYAGGGYPLVGWVSVGCCLAAAALGLRFPEPPRSDGPPDEDGDPDAEENELGYFATLRAGLLAAVSSRAVRMVVLAVSVVSGIDAVEEYFPLIAKDWGVSTELVPVLLVGIPLVGAAGAAFGGTAARWRMSTLAVLFGVSAVVFGATGLAHSPYGLIGVAVFYGLYRMVLVVVDAQLQQRIDSRTRATVTSVAGLGTELAALVLFALWSLGQVVLVAALMAVVALLLPYWLGTRRSAPAPTPEGVEP